MGGPLLSLVFPVVPRSIWHGCGTERLTRCVRLFARRVLVRTVRNWGGIVGFRLRGSRRLVVVSAVALLIVAVLLAAPFILINDLGQAFSAASMLMSGMALTGVAASLFYQAQQTKVVRDERDRSTHREMIYLAMEDRDLAACWEPPDTPMTFERYRQVSYTNL